MMLYKYMLKYCQKRRNITKILLLIIQLYFLIWGYDIMNTGVILDILCQRMLKLVGPSSTLCRGSDKAGFIVESHCMFSKVYNM